MGLLDGLVGGAVGAEMISVVNGLIEKHGGVQGIVSQLHQNGLGETVKSWVGSGPNSPISASQVQQAFGDTIKALATKFGVDPNVAAQHISQLLPQAIDKLTPGGTVPQS